MNNPRISLLIPTRERCRPLEFTLKTALAQQSQNYEIVVCDNFSQDNTRGVVESFNDPRIKYFNTGKRLSMCDNWDFGVDQTRGEFVMVIGDDDGVVPGGIDFLDAFIQKNPAPVYFWDIHIYSWSMNGRQPEINQISVPREPYTLDLKKATRASISWGSRDIQDLPKLYQNSAVSRTLLDKIKQKAKKRFHSVAPDMFTAFSLPVFADKAIHVGRCIAVQGRAQESNSGGKENVKIFLDEYGEYKWHSTLNPKFPDVTIIPVDSALVAMELFPEFYKNIDFNYNAMWAVYRKKIGKNLFEIIKDRHEIRKYHPFNVMTFLFYLFGHYVSTGYKKFLSRKSRIARRDLPQDILPNNIFEFVNLVAEGKNP